MRKSIIIIIIALLIIVICSSGLIAKIKCEKICDNEGSLAHKMIPGGGLLTIKNDVCVCYFENKIKSFKLGEYEK